MHHRQPPGLGEPGPEAAQRAAGSRGAEKTPKPGCELTVTPGKSHKAGPGVKCHAEPSFPGPSVEIICFFQLGREKQKKPDGIDNILKLDTKIIFLKITLLSGQTCQGSNSETLHTSLGYESWRRFSAVPTSAQLWLQEKPLGGPSCPRTNSSLCPGLAAEGTGPASPARCPSSPGRGPGASVASKHHVPHRCPPAHPSASSTFCLSGSITLILAHSRASYGKR